MARPPDPSPPSASAREAQPTERPMTETPRPSHPKVRGLRPLAVGPGSPFAMYARGAEAGLPVDQVMAFLGHRDIRTAMRH